MRARIRFIAPLAARRCALTAACGSSGSSGTGGGRSREQRQRRRATRCAPVAGDKLVVLEDDKHLQNADNVIPAVNAAAAQANPALLPALNAVSAKLDHRGPGRHERRRRRRPQERRPTSPPAWVERERRRPTGCSKGSGPVAVGGADFTESTVLANVYADVLKAAGFDASVREVGSRELYLKALEAGTEIQAFPEYLATVTEFLDRPTSANARSPAATSTRPWPRCKPLAETAGLAFGEPSEAADQNAFAVTKAFADKLERDDAVRAGRRLRRRLAGPRRPGRVPDPAVLPAGPREDLRPEVRQLPGVRRHRRPADQGRDPAGRGLDRAWSSAPTAPSPSTKDPVLPHAREPRRTAGRRAVQYQPPGGSCSPAATGAASRLPSGASGHDQRGS